MKLLISAIAALAAGAIVGAQAGEPTPLFASNDVLEITLVGPFKKLARTTKEIDGESGLIRVTASGEEKPITLAPRGKSRRNKDVCAFPPLSVSFPEKPEKASLFHKQGKIKLVTYCNRSKRHQDVLLREYAAYRLYNAFTEESFRVRLAEISYQEPDRDEPDITRMGFFIEDADDLARRVDLKEVDRGRTPIALYRQDAAARAALFQYMIGNLDWDITAGPVEDDCCHNAKILGPAKAAEADLTPAPYDFDMSGFVNAPYAVPPGGLVVRSVKTRVYRGFCAHDAQTLAAAADIRTRRQELEMTVRNTPGLSAKGADKMIDYLDGFFDDIADDDAVRKNLISKCRG